MAPAPKHRRISVLAPIRSIGGFTLIELVMVLVMLGVLAVFAAPRVFNRGDFEARGFHDQTLSILRFAQKTAIAQRRTVCVAVGGSTVTLSIANAAAINSCSVNLPGPTGEASLTAKSGVSFSSIPVSFNFDGLGQPVEVDTVVPPPPIPVLSAIRVLQVANVSRSITVEAVTGYVHD